jgi:hypothetical protein
MTHRDSEDHAPARRWQVPHGRRTRVVAAIMGCVVGLGVPIVALGMPTLTADQQPVRVPDDPAGLGTTAAVPSETPETGPTDGMPAGAQPTDSTTALPGIPTPPNLPDGPLGIPGAVLDAYQFAQRTLAAISPACHLSWSVLAGIGRIESNHASDGRVDAFGNTLGPILGPQLDGSPGVAAIPDTDHGVLDGDTVWDRAVGPMQFIPSTWGSFGVDGNGDGVANPNNVYDSTIATGLYLCAGGANMSDPIQLQAAVFRYNHSDTYVDVVLEWAHAYLAGAVPTPSALGPVPPGINGNGGRLIPPSPAPAVAATAVAVAEAGSVTPPPTTSSPQPPPLATLLPTTAPPTVPATPSGTASPSPSPMSTASPSPTATASPASTATASPASPPATSAPAESPSPSPAPTVTPTPSPSPPAPTATPSPPPPRLSRLPRS